MDRTHDNTGLQALLNDLTAHAVERDVAPEAADRAVEATLRAVKVPDGPMSAQTVRRVEAYFTAVVRRDSVRRRAAPRAAARFVVASVVADLRSTGRSGRDIWSELERGWSRSVPADVLEEYRARLCG